MLRSVRHFIIQCDHHGCREEVGGSESAVDAIKEAARLNWAALDPAAIYWHYPADWPAKLIDPRERQIAAWYCPKHWPKKLRAARSPDACCVCGCTDDRACAGGCFWIVPRLCPECFDFAAAGIKPAKKLRSS
jgi:hypothetical protein